MTIGEIISTIRTLIKQHSDDTIYTDEFIYNLLLTGRAYLIERDYKKYRRTSDWNKQTYCIELEKGKAHDCSCVKVGCTILKTKYKIPKPLQVRGADKIEIFTLDFESVDYVRPDYVSEYLLDDIYSSRPLYTVINNKVLLFNVPNNQWKAIQIRSISEDPTEWEDITLCDENGNPTERLCYDVQDDDFPIDNDLLIPLYETTLNMLRLPLQLTEDLTNDASSEIKV